MADITTGLEYHLPLNDNAASTAVVPSVDTFAVGNSTLQGGDNTEDKYNVDLNGNPFFQFNGVDDWVEMPSFASDLGDDDMSISWWTKYASSTPSAGADAGQVHFGATGANVDNLMPWNGDGLGYISTFRSNPSLSRVDGVVLPAGIDRTEWFHIAITQDTGANGWNLYFNDTLVTSVTGLSSLSWGATPEFRIGQSRTGTSNFWDGGIRDFRVWSRQLAAEDVAELVTATITGDNAQPIQNPFNFSDFE